MGTEHQILRAHAYPWLSLAPPVAKTPPQDMEQSDVLAPGG